MRRADWLTLVLVVALGATSLSLIVGAFLTNGNSANLLIALGVTLAVGCLFLVVQIFYTVARERQTRPELPALPASGSPVSSDIGLKINGPRSNSYGRPNPAQQEEQGINDSPVTIYRALSAAPSKSELVSRARQEVLAMVVSGRNFFQPQLHHTILEKVRNPSDRTKFRLLVLNHYSAKHFVEARSAMMDMRRGLEFQPVYEQDFDTVREYSSQVTIEDPTRENFDVRFYGHMPTTYFYIVDGVLYVSFLLSKPITSSPLIIVRPVNDEASAIIANFRAHFEHYWNSSRFFITLIGMTSDGQTILVNNRKRGLEWPTGFIEPNEDLASGAAREFREETGYSVGRPVELAKTPMGYFFAARVGNRVNSGSAREVSEVKLVRELPERSLMSFSRDYADFRRYLALARDLLPDLPPPA